MRLQKRLEQGNLRTLPACKGGVDFASNDFLGLARSPLLKQKLIEEIGKHSRMGSSGSRLLTGNSIVAEELERHIAAFHGYEAALLYNCGYMANLGVMSAIQGGVIYYDAHLHASTKMGLQGRGVPFRHNDLEHLEKRLKSSQGRDWIYVESIYSTDGSLAPLKNICELAKRYKAKVIVDEAHATGLFGPQGRGLVAENGVSVFAHVITFGKALGVFGAIVLGSQEFIAEMINFSPSFIYTTSLPFYALAAIQCSYALFPAMDAERLHVRQLASCFGSHSPIQFVLIPGNQAAKEAARDLNQKGFNVMPLLSPTVQRGKEGLRLCLHSYNTINEVERLLSWVE